MDGKSAESWSNQGDKLFEQKRYDEALECYLNATDIDPGLSDAWQNMGLICLQFGQPGEAGVCFERAANGYKKPVSEGIVKKEYPCEEPLQRQAVDTEELYLKGIRCVKEGQIDEGLAIFDRVIELNPSDCRVLNSKGAALARLRRYREAYEMVYQALIIDPSYQPAINNLHNLQKILVVPGPDTGGKPGTSGKRDKGSSPSNLLSRLGIRKK